MESRPAEILKVENSSSANITGLTVQTESPSTDFKRTLKSRDSHYAIVSVHVTYSL